MNNQTFFRVGGIAVILAVLFSLGAYISPFLLAVGSVCMAIFVFALYLQFKPENSSFSLVSAIVGIAGALGLAVFAAINGIQASSISGIFTWMTFFLPPLLFGYLGYRYSQAGVPRLLAIIGLVGGIFGLLNFLVTWYAGGDYSNPNNPALAPLIMGTYYVGMLPTLVWMVWSGIVLLRKK